MKASEFLGSQYLSAADINGEVIARVIESIGDETITNPEGKTRRRLTLGLAGVKKKLVLNATNLQMLTDMFGDETDSWLGKTISLSKDKTNFAGRKVDCIRVYPVKNSSEIAF